MHWKKRRSLHLSIDFLHLHCHLLGFLLALLPFGLAIKMNPVEFLRKNHYRFLEQHSGHVPVSPGFHDIGGMYTSVSVTKRGIIDLPFHINRIYHQSIFLDFFKDNEENKQKLITLALRKCDEALSGHLLQEGLLILCCGKSFSPDHLLDVTSLFAGKPITIPPTSWNSVNQANERPYTVDFYPIQRIPAQVKYTRWVLERQPLIDRREEGVQETIIYDQDIEGLRDHLTEGLTSTFYILLDDGKILIPPTDKILYGSIQRWIQFIAPLLHLHIIEEPITFPHLLHHAKGAFLTSSGRILQPIHKMKISKEIQSKHSVTSEFPNEIVFKYDDVVRGDSGNHHSIFEKLKIIAFHLMYDDGSLTSSEDSKNSSDLLTNEELKEIEGKVLSCIGYNPWLKPKNNISWDHELLQESLKEEILTAINCINLN